MRHRKSAWRCRCPQRSVRACSYPPILANAMFSPATVRAPEERSRRRAICSHAGFEAQRAYRLRRRARNDSRCGFVDDGLSATGPLAVEKSDDFPTARPFAHKLHSAPIILIKINLESTRGGRLVSGGRPGTRWNAVELSPGDSPLVHGGRLTFATAAHYAWSLAPVGLELRTTVRAADQDAARRSAGHRLCVVKRSA